VTDDGWKQMRKRTIEATFQSGRSVFANSEGAFHRADGGCEQLSDSTAELPIPELTPPPPWWARVIHWLKEPKT
jgi:hypothetical protein